MHWADRHGLTAEDADLLDDVLYALADQHIGWLVEKQKQEPRK
jgi:hypothetical protein